jgi:hypothetical protein
MLCAELLREGVGTRLFTAHDTDEFVAGEGVDAGKNAVICNLAGPDESPAYGFCSHLSNVSGDAAGVNCGHAGAQGLRDRLIKAISVIRVR